MPQLTNKDMGGGRLDRKGKCLQYIFISYVAVAVAVAVVVVVAAAVVIAAVAAAGERTVATTVTIPFSSFALLVFELAFVQSSHLISMDRQKL